MADYDQAQTQYRDIMRHRALADALMSKMGDTSPTRSKWEGLSRAILPLIGALIKNQSDSQYGELSDSANPEFAQMAQSDNPMAIVAASKNPLIRAMLPQMAQMQMQSAMNARGKGLETSAVGQAKLGYEPQLAGKTEEATGQAKLGYEPQLMRATSDARNASELHYAPQIAGATAKATLPYDVQKSIAPINAEMQMLGMTSGQQESSDQYVVGRTYTDANGFKAVYRGNGQWDEVK